MKKEFKSIFGFKCVIVSPNDNSVGHWENYPYEQLKHWQAYDHGLGEWSYQWGVTNRTAMSLARFIASRNGYKLVKKED